jgi:hypothetical protein
MSRGWRDAASFRTDRRLIRRELMTAALAGLSAVLPALAEEQSGKMTQIAAAYQSTPKGLFSCAVCSFFIRPHSCKGGERQYQPDRLVQAFRLARLTRWEGSECSSAP